MKTLQEVAAVVDKKAKPKTQWTLPYYGYYIQQFYFKSIKKRPRGKLNKKKRYVFQDTVFEKSPLRNRRSISPNFVHSYDALHMLLTLYQFFVRFKEAPIAPIHDCLGVSVDKLGIVKKKKKIYKEMFVKIYKENDILEEFKKENEELQKKEKVVVAKAKKGIPEVFKGELKIEEVLKAEFFIS
jgi:DNA-directed RNA polymerase